MPITLKMDPMERDLELMFRDDLSPAARSKALASFARNELTSAQEINRSVLGRVPPHQTFVDGSKGVALDRVRPDGIIVVEFELVSELLVWISNTLIANSPVGSGRDPHPGLYKASHTLFIDGKETPVGSDLPVAEEYVFINLQPYARKIEQGQSKQFPDGVYDATAALARQRFGNVAKIQFTYRGLIGLGSGRGTLVDPLRDPTRNATRARVGGTGRDRGRFAGMGGPKAYNVSKVRYPCIVVSQRT